jgi:hypothetical protein
MSDEKKEALPYTLVDGVLTVVMPNGESKTVQQGDDPKRYDDVLNAIREDRWAEVPSLICPKQRIASFSDEHIEVIDSVVHIDGKAVPSALSDRIIDYSEQDLPYQPLVSFWRNLNMNPSHTAVQRLYGFLEANRHPITPDGHFIGYRGIKADFTDQRTGTIDNSPGEVVTMPRNEVDETDQDCSHGLHVANYDFANGFGPVCVMVKVHPRDVVSIPSNYGTAKMRVCQYEVLQQVNEGSTESLHDDGSELEGADDPPQIPVADESPDQLHG